MREIIKVSLGHERNYQGRLVRREIVKVDIPRRVFFSLDLLGGRS
jgi:hypothetical protein